MRSDLQASSGAWYVKTYGFGNNVYLGASRASLHELVRNPDIETYGDTINDSVNFRRGEPVHGSTGSKCGKRLAFASTQSLVRPEALDMSSIRPMDNVNPTEKRSIDQKT